MRLSDFKTEIKVGEVTIHLPDPPNLSDIFGYNLSTSSQRYIPNEIPKDLNFLPRQDQVDFIKKLMVRRENGFWFLNNGNIEYITGVHDFYLSYWKLDTGLPKFIDADRDFFYFWRASVKNKNCFGTLYIANRREGKALDINTDIPTSTGWKKMKDIQEGDIVFGSDGKEAPVTFSTDIMYNHKCYDVLFSDGSTIKADSEHLWIAYNKKSRVKKTGPEVLTTEFMYNTQKVGIENNYSIKNTEPVLYNKKKLKIPPYILGLWLGDGSKNASSITSIDEQIIDSWSNYGKTVGLDCMIHDSITHRLAKNNREIYSERWSVNPVRQALKDYNIFNNKRIPIDYLQSDVEDRMELLKGIMDTDGHIMNKRNTCEVCSKSFDLISDYKELICSLGYKGVITSKLNKKYNKIYYYFRFNHLKKYPFKLKRKLDSCTSVKTNKNNNNHRYIIKITECETVPVKCIAVNNKDNSYLCTKSYIVTHNTHKSNCINYEIVSKNHNSSSGIQSKTGTDGKRVFQKLIQSWKRLPDIWKPVDSGETNPKTELKFEEPGLRGAKGQKKIYKDVLDSYIDYQAAVEEAYDGQKKIFLHNDEFGKTVDVNICDRWDIQKFCLIDEFNGGIIGKSLHTSTIEEMEKKGGANAKKMWDDSNPLELNDLGQTKTGLWRYFKPADYGYGRFVNEYGYSDRDKSKEYILAKRKGLTGTSLYNLVRKEPLTIEEAFIITDKSDVFPSYKIYEQQSFNFGVKAGTVRVGNFIEKEDQTIDFFDDPNGNWKVSWMPSPENRNKTVINNGKVVPGDKMGGAIGVDPYDHATTSGNRQSDAGIYGFRNYSASEPYMSHCFVCQYLHRPEIPEMMYEEALKAARFYGWEFLSESQKPGIMNYAKAKGFGAYVMRTQVGDYTTGKSKKWVDGLPTTGEIARQDIVNGLTTYIYTYIGRIDAKTQLEHLGLGEHDDSIHGNCPFEELLDDWLKFDVNKWTDHDATVSSMIAFHAARRHFIKKRNKPEEIDNSKGWSFPKHKI